MHWPDRIKYTNIETFILHNGVQIIMNIHVSDIILKFFTKIIQLKNTKSTTDMIICY